MSGNGRPAILLQDGWMYQVHCGDGVITASAKSIGVALDKAIPKKPKQSDKVMIDYICPVCGYPVGWVDALAGETPNYCQECGQKIDWSGFVRTEVINKLKEQEDE